MAMDFSIESLESQLGKFPRFLMGKRKGELKVDIQVSKHASEPRLLAAGWKVHGEVQDGLTGTMLVFTKDKPKTKEESE